MTAGGGDGSRHVLQPANTRRKILSQNLAELLQLLWSDLLSPTGMAFIFPLVQAGALIPRPCPPAERLEFLSGQLVQVHRHPSKDNLGMGAGVRPWSHLERLQVLEPERSPGQR